MNKTMSISMTQSVYSVNDAKIQGRIMVWVCNLICAVLLSTYASSPLLASDANTSDGLVAITVYKTAACGCCDKWVGHLQEDGFEVTIETVADTNAINEALGIPPQLASCHTAVAGDYWVEGHVPTDIIHKLLHEKPVGIKGITVPGMPPGSPGMESPNPVTYQILSVNDDGQVAVYATREGKSQ